MSTNINIKRVEEKYPLSFLQSSKIYSALSAMLLPDKYNNPDSYMIRSVYFDDYSETAYYDKINGVDYRIKLRLRIYPPNYENVKLELKEKKGGVQQKHTLLINRHDAEALIHKEYDIALENKNIKKILLENSIPIHSMRPVVMNQYRRSAFMHAMNNTRITIDREILSSETDFDLFADHPALFPAMDYYESLLEVKYDHFLLQWISDLFHSYGLNREAYSKYVFSRRLFENFIS